MSIARRRALLAATLAITGAALGGCASVPGARPAVPPQVLSGRFAVTAQANGRSDSGSGRFTLTTAGPALTLDLATPVGTTLARLERNAGGARLTAPREDGAMTTVAGADAEALLGDAFGWSIPVDGLADWLAGRPAAGTPAQVRTDADGRVSTIVQSGWTIEIEERFSGPSGAPRRLRATRPASGPAPALTLRLVLDEGAGAQQSPAQ